jgi:hypothetical protein
LSFVVFAFTCRKAFPKFFDKHLCLVKRLHRSHRPQWGGDFCCLNVGLSWWAIDLLRGHHKKQHRQLL